MTLAAITLSLGPLQNVIAFHGIQLFQLTLSEENQKPYKPSPQGNIRWEVSNPSSLLRLKFAMENLSSKENGP